MIFHENAKLFSVSAITPKKFRSGSRFLQIRDNNTKIFTAHLPVTPRAKGRGKFSRASVLPVNLPKEGNSYGIGGVFPHVFLQRRRFPPRRAPKNPHAPSAATRRCGGSASLYSPRFVIFLLRRYSRGDAPHSRRNAEANLLWLSYPTMPATSTTERRVSARSPAAYIIFL